MSIELISALGLQMMEEDEGNENPRLFDPSRGSAYGNSRTPPSEIIAYNPDTEFSHLQYSTFRAPAELLVDKFEVVIAIGSACRGDEAATYGVFFGPDSQHNISGRLPIRERQIKQNAEFYATAQALNLVNLIVSRGDTTSVHGVIFLTDSRNLTTAMAKHIHSWIDNGFRTARGTPLVLADSIRNLNEAIENLESDGIRVSFWCVPPADNPSAKRLAKLALDLLSPPFPSANKAQH